MTYYFLQKGYKEHTSEPERDIHVSKDTEGANLLIASYSQGQVFSRDNGYMEWGF